MPEALALLEHQDQQGTTTASATAAAAAAATGSAAARAAAARESSDIDSEVRYTHAQSTLHSSYIHNCSIHTHWLASS
jgi:hypothetical protein